MEKNQINLIEQAISFYHSHCVKMAVMQRGVNRPRPGVTMTRAYKTKIENAEQKREEWSKKAEEVKETIFLFDQQSEKLLDNYPFLK